jgi:hypothetical protein
VRLTAPTSGLRGLSFSFRLSARASVRYTVARRNGSPARGRCPVRGGTSPGRYTGVSDPSRDGSSGRNTTSLGTIASRPAMLRAGPVRTPLAKVAGAKRLRPGTYVLHVAATDAFGQTSKRRSVKFWVLKAR